MTVRYSYTLTQERDIQSGQTDSVMESENVNGEQTFNSASPEIRIALITTVFVVSFIILAGNLLTVVSILCFTKTKEYLQFSSRHDLFDRHFKYFGTKCSLFVRVF